MNKRDKNENSGDQNCNGQYLNCNHLKVKIDSGHSDILKLVFYQINCLKNMRKFELNAHCPQVFPKGIQPDDFDVFPEIWVNLRKANKGFVNKQ